MILGDDLRGTKSPLVTLPLPRHTTNIRHFARVHLGVLRPAKLRSMVAVTALALAAAFLFALSAFLQQRAARTIVGADTASLRDASGV